MKTYKQAVLNFLRKEDGPTAVECALMLALVVVVCVVAINTANGPKTPMVEPIVIETVQR